MGERGSLWIETEPGEPFGRLEEDLDVDVAIIGAGVVGVMSAYLLQQAGLRVAVLERSRVLRGVTGHTTAKLTSQHGLFYHKLIEEFGEDLAQLYADANQQAVEEVQRIVEDLGVECQFVRAPAYTYTTKQGGVDDVRAEVEAARSLGLPASLVTDTELPFRVEAAVRFSDQAHLHPRRFLLALVQEVVEGGGRFFEHTPVTDFSDGEPCTVHTPDATVTAEDVIVATNVPINDTKYFVTRMQPVRAYGIAARIEGEPPRGMYINDDSPTRSVRGFRDGDRSLLVVVGEGHLVGERSDTRECLDALEAFARTHYAVEAVDYRWSTQDYYPADGVPYIGRYSPGSEHLYTATGLKGWGLTHGVVAAQLFVDHVLGTDGPWQPLYDPFSPSRVAGDLVSNEFISQSKKSLGHLLERLRSQGLPEVERGAGVVADVDGDKLALFRSADGVLHARSAVCTHMGCVVRFNEEQESWDCPCHGSRFSVEGEVLHGPATEDLAGERN